MVVREFYLRQDQTDFLRSLPGTEAENVRRAIDEYIAKIKEKQSTLSPSVTIVNRKEELND